MIADGKVQALIFETEGEAFGRTREVWFVAREQLFQVTTHVDNDSLIGPVLESLTFD